MFKKVCENIREDLKSLDVCIKEFRRCLTEEKILCGKLILSHDFVKDISNEIIFKLTELKTFVTQVQSPNVQIIDLESRVTRMHDDFGLLKLKKERMLKIFSLLRENLTSWINYV